MLCRRSPSAILLPAPPLQLDPKDLSEQLKRQGASIPGVRPGRATAEYITKTLDRMSVLGEPVVQRGCGCGRAVGNMRCNVCTPTPVEHSHF